MTLTLRYLAQMKPPEMTLHHVIWNELRNAAQGLGWKPLGTILLLDDFALLHPSWDGN